jgi:carboxymethylenebutenolidase
VPPTYKKVEIPFTAVVNIRGDRLYHEHIAWDQASVLRQLGLLPEYLPFPYPVPEGMTPVAAGAAAGNKKGFEYRLPVAGVETAQKMRDRNSGLSNGMFEFKVREV